MSEDINIGAISEALNEKADRDLVNTIPPYLKTCYVNGVSGYNIWSNGYCEQWSNSAVTSTGEVTISLLKTMKDTNYQVITKPIATSYKSDTNNAVRNTSASYFNIVFKKTQENFGTRVSDEMNIVSVDWRVCGYLAEGQY